MAAWKGFATKAATELQVKQLLSLDVEWFYTWGKLHNLGQPANDFTPMIWDEKTANAAAIAEIERNRWKTSSSSLLGFNEPDHTKQANMSVEQALGLWPVLEGSVLKLGSPATVSPNRRWMNDFMEGAENRGLRIDFVTCHIYGWPDAESFLDKIDDLHDRWGKPVWVTEYAVADFSATSLSDNRYSRKDVNSFMEDTIKGMRQRSYVKRFAWKTRASTDPKMGTSALFLPDGSLTSTGELYASIARM